MSSPTSGADSKNIDLILKIHRYTPKTRLFTLLSPWKVTTRTNNKKQKKKLAFGDGHKCGADTKRKGQLHWHKMQAHAWATTQIARGLLCTSTEIVDMPTCKQTTNK